MKKYIDVVCLMSRGKVLPKSVIWEDGRVFNVDKLVEVKKCASTKAGGVGVRYEVKILGKQKFLFLDEYTWFIEL